MTIAIHDEILTGDEEDPMYDRIGITLFIDCEGAESLMSGMLFNTGNEDAIALRDALIALTQNKETK